MNMTKQQVKKVQKKSGKTTSSKYNKQEETLNYIRKDIIPYVLPICGKRTQEFISVDWSDRLIPENTLSGPSQKELHKEAKEEGRRQRTQFFRVLNFLNNGPLQTLYIMDDVNEET